MKTALYEKVHWALRHPRKLGKKISRKVDKTGVKVGRSLTRSKITPLRPIGRNLDPTGFKVGFLSDPFGPLVPGSSFIMGGAAGLTTGVAKRTAGRMRLAKRLSKKQADAPVGLSVKEHLVNELQGFEERLDEVTELDVVTYDPGKKQHIRRIVGPFAARDDKREEATARDFKHWKEGAAKGGVAGGATMAGVSAVRDMKIKSLTGSLPKHFAGRAAWAGMGGALVGSMVGIGANTARSRYGKGSDELYSKPAKTSVYRKIPNSGLMSKTTAIYKTHHNRKQRKLWKENLVKKTVDGNIKWPPSALPTALESGDEVTELGSLGFKRLMRVKGGLRRRGDHGAVKKRIWPAEDAKRRARDIKVYGRKRAEEMGLLLESKEAVTGFGQAYDDFLKHKKRSDTVHGRLGTIQRGLDGRHMEITEGFQKRNPGRGNGTWADDDSYEKGANYATGVLMPEYQKLEKRRRIQARNDRAANSRLDRGSFRKEGTLVGAVGGTMGGIGIGTAFARASGKFKPIAIGGMVGGFAGATAGESIGKRIDKGRKSIDG